MNSLARVCLKIFYPEVLINYYPFGKVNRFIISLKKKYLYDIFFVRHLIRSAIFNFNGLIIIFK